MDENVRAPARACHECSAALDDHARFCENCGAGVRTVAPPPVSPTMPEPERAPVYQEMPAPVAAPKPRSKHLAIVAAAGGVLLLGGGAFATVLLTRGEGSQAPVAEKPPVTEAAPPARPRPAPAATSKISDSLVVGFAPEAVNRGRCFTRETNRRAYLKVQGQRYYSDFIQCGDDRGGFASGSYDLRLPEVGGKIVRAHLSARVVVDEATRQFASVRVQVSVDGRAVCQARASYGSPGTLSCDLPVGSLQGARLTINQTVRPNSRRAYAGVLHPRISITSRQVQDGPGQ